MTTRERWLPSAAGFTLGILLTGAGPLAAQVECRVVTDALSKVHSVPAHAYSTTKLAGKEIAVEMIYAGGKLYTRAGGPWSSGPIPAEGTKPQNDKAVCKFVKDETVNGEIAALYSTHDVSPKGVTDTQVWISKSRGLPLRVDMDINTGPGKEATLHTSARYEYGNVKPPI